MASEAVFWLCDGAALNDAELERYRSWLGPDELTRYARFIRLERKRQFVTGRGMLRVMLGELLGIPAADVVLEERPWKAPLLVRRGAERVGFSISHSGSWVACAVSADTALGLDIEVMDPGRDFLGLASQTFDAERCAWLASVPPTALPAEFYRLWSTHEALIKLGTDAASTHVIAHEALSIVLCTERPVGWAPRAHQSCQ